MEYYPDFKKLAKKQAQFIAEGGLKIDPMYSQISPKAWKGLATINEMGFITNDSQAGDIASERAYVSGFMFPHEVEQFVDNLNMWSDKVGFFLLVEPEYRRTAFITLTRDYRKDRGWHGFTGFKLGGYTREWELMEMKQVGIPPEMPLVKVNVFDPKWHRPAWSKNGLFKDVIEALNPQEEHPAPE